MKKLLFILISCIFCSCGKQHNSGIDSMGKQLVPQRELKDIEAPRTLEPPPPPEFSLEKGSKIIKEGNMKFDVANLEQAKTKIDEILEGANGYYENELFASNGSRNTYSLKLRIPNIKFDSLVYLIENGIGNLKAKNITAQDVTEEYVDLKIRLENKLAYLNQYKTILAKTKTIKEILEVKEKIRQLEVEIESKKGRLNFLDDKVNLSTLQLDISEIIPQEFSNVPGFGLKIKNAFKNGFQGFLTFILLLINIWPFIIIGIFLFLGRKAIANKFRKKNKENLA